MAGVQELKLDGKLVKDVSRSFYLTLRLLPKDLRQMISMGYLLARISDTIADTASIPIKEREETLRLYIEDVKGMHASESLVRKIAQLFCNQKHEGERVLMGKVQEILRAVTQFSSKEQRLLQEVTQIITEGQLWDLSYFSGEGLATVKTEEELDLYTYQVAGSVGEFWTNVLALKGYLREDELEEMRNLGVRYGKGLQMTNIIRDIPEDFANGRIYIPTDGGLLDDVLQASESFLEKAKAYLKDGVKYSSNLPAGRLKVSTILPAKLGLRTLDAIQSANADERRGKVKISKKVVYQEMIGAFLKRGA